MYFHFWTDKSHCSGEKNVHSMRAAAAGQKSVKTRKAFPASQPFSHTHTHLLLQPAAPSPPQHTHTHRGACLRGNMDREGMLVRSIYYGRIGSEATERLLERFGHEGSFLLRDSETVRGAYCLCVRKAPFVHTYRLVRSTDGWSLQGSGVRLQSCRTLETLIESYRRLATSDVNIAPLTDPLDKTQIQYLSPGQEFVYMETCSSSSSVC